MLRNHLAIAAIGAALAGCEMGDNISTATPAPLTAHEQLSKGTVFLFDPDASTVTVHAVIQPKAGEGGPARELYATIPLAGGVVVGSLDENDSIALDALTLNHRDVILPLDGDDVVRGPAMFGLTLRVRYPVAFASTLWSDDGNVALSTDAAALANVDFQLNGKDFVAPTESRLTAIDLSAMILPDPDRVHLALFGETRPFWWIWHDATITVDLGYAIDGFVARETQ